MTQHIYKFPEVSRHIYDIDSFEILDNLKLKLSNNISFLPAHLKDFEFLKINESVLIKQMKESGIKYNSHKKHRNFILPSSWNCYYIYLGYKILCIDVNRIEALLNFQSERYEGNHYGAADNFIGLVEFTLYQFVSTMNFFKEDERLEKIMNWVKECRKLSLTKSTLKNKKSKEIIIVFHEEAIATIIIKRLKEYFPKEEREIINDIIIKGKFAIPLTFIGNQNQLVEFFKRLRYNKMIKHESNHILTLWIINNFKIQNKNSELKELKYESVLEILRKHTKSVEPSKSNRILDDIAPFIRKENRKLDIK